MSKTIDRGLHAWAQDVEVRTERTPSPQIEVIPLMCVWALAAHRDKAHARTMYNFSQAVLGNDHARTVWAERARRGHYILGTIEQLPFERMKNSISSPTAPRPYRFDEYLITDGRPVDTEHIHFIDLSLVKSLGHAFYNSTSGGTRLSLEPLGPHTDDPLGFLRVSGEHVHAFVEELEAEKGTIG